jgi:hypothetical protein
MEIVSEETHRVLAYVDALNRHGVKPRRLWVEQFADNPEPKVKRIGGLAAIQASARRAATLGERVVADETFTDYLARLGWAEFDHDAVELTSMGRALLKALNAPAIEETETDVFEVVLDPEDPFAYAQALHGVSSVKNALLIEPYFRLEQLMDVAEFDNITRVLLGTNLKARDYEVLATGLAALPEGRSLKVRKAKNLHDRYLIPSDEGRVLMLGSSLGGIGRKVSTMTTLGEVASRALREAHEELWRSADVLPPKDRSIDTQAKASAQKATSKKPAAKKTQTSKRGE